jgi:hypothetical protein
MAIATNGSCRLHHDTFGDPELPTLLMINGLGSQCTNYPRQLWERSIDVVTAHAGEADRM